MNNFFLLFNMKNDNKIIRTIKKQFIDSCTGQEIINFIKDDIKDSLATMKFNRIVYFDKDFECFIDVNNNTFFNEKAILEVYLEEVHVSIL